MGFFAASGCDLGLTLSHGGGYPGYGSIVMLLPDKGVGVFSFSNRTYGAPVLPAQRATRTPGKLSQGRVGPVCSSPSVPSRRAAASLTRNGTGAPAA